MTTANAEEATEPPQQTPEGQLAGQKRPMTDEDGDGEKLAARREANRVHALKSRQRSKALLQELQRTVTQLSGDKAELERENAVLRAQTEVLQQQNIALTQSQRMLLMRSGHMGAVAQPSPAAPTGMNAFPAGALFGLSQMAAMSNAGAGIAAPEGNLKGPADTPVGMDQAAVAAAATAMIQGQAAAFGHQFQQAFMGGFSGMPQAPQALAAPPVQTVPSIAVTTEAAATTATTATTASGEEGPEKKTV
jgi:hypothetical protein